MDRDQVHFLARSGKRVSLKPSAFIGRFLAHVLPKAFVKVRHYGLMAASNAAALCQKAHDLLAAESPDEQPVAAHSATPVSWQEWLALLLGIDATRCPRCHTGRLVRIPVASFPNNGSRPPPSSL